MESIHNIQLTEQDMQVAFNAASLIHEDWRENYYITNGNIHRIKITKEGYETNINVPFNELLPEFQEMNLLMTQFVVKLFKLAKQENYTNEEVYYNIHEYWLELNPYAKNGNLDVPFHQLTPSEQDKDIRVYNIVLGYYLAIVDS